MPVAPPDPPNPAPTAAPPSAGDAPQHPRQALSRPRARLTLLAAAAVAATVLTLGGGWRHLDEEQRALLDERARLDPLGLTLQVQRGLVGHRDVTDRLLRGRGGLEAERRLRAADVNTDVQRLQATLRSGRWVQALGEAQDLQTDWRTLLHALERRQLDAGASQLRHTLLLEQAVQVMDLLADGAPRGSLPALLPALARQTLPSVPLSVPLSMLPSPQPAPLAEEGATPAPALRPLHPWEPLLQAVEARRAALGDRQAVLAERQLALAAAGGLGLLAALLLLALNLRRVAPRADGAPPAPPAGDRRHGPGRRVTDRLPPTPAELARAALRPWLAPRRAQRRRGTAAEPPPPRES